MDRCFSDDFLERGVVALAKKIGWDSSKISYVFNLSGRLRIRGMKN